MYTFISSTYAALRRLIVVQPIRGAVLLGIIFAILNLALSSVTFAVLSLVLPRSEWGTSAAVSVVQTSPVTLFFLAVLFIPIYETLLAQVLPIEIIRRIGGNRLICIALSALLFGGGHYVNGGLVHGVMTFVGGAVLGFAYTLARSQGFWPAFVTASIAHGIHNFVLLFVVARLFPKWA